MEPTRRRRTVQIRMTTTFYSAATRTLVRSSSSYSSSMKIASVRGRLFLFCIISVGCLRLTVAGVAQNTATGVLVSGRSITLQIGQKLPWSFDITREIKAEYPPDARIKRYQGSAVLRLNLDPKTGAVTSARV